MQRKVLFAGTEFEQEHQRGIYFYTKSLISAVKSNEFETGILTQANACPSSIALTQAYQSLLFPQDAYPRDVKRLIKRYLKYTFLNHRTDTLTPNSSRMFTEESQWFLKEIDFFANIPGIYAISHLAKRLPQKYSNLQVNLKNLDQNDLIFTTSPFNIESKKQKIIQTVHDLIPLNVMTNRENPQVFYKGLKACANADKILTVSDFSQQQFLEFFPQTKDRIQTVYQPIPTDDHSLYLSSLPKIQEAVLRKYKLKPKQYMYYVGAIEARKNIHRLIQAYELATNKDPDMPLVLSGGIDHHYANQSKISKYFAEPKYDRNGQPLPKKHNIIKTDYVTEVEKLCLIRNARAFLFPTLNEGFGIPALEAQTLGAPVLTTNNSSLPEVVGNTALMVEDPFNIEEMSVQIERLWNDDALCERLSKEGLINAERFSKENFKKNIGQFLQDI